NEDTERRPCTEQSSSTPGDEVCMLGDIFHSAPVLVDPPARTSGLLCRLGLSNQCLVSLTQTPTPKQPETAYEDYVAAHQRRDKVVLVGANDGMLHAFRGGRWVAEDNPDTPSLDECPSTANCTGYYDLGDGEELWAFIPPDLLPKLSQLLLAQPGEHPYFVDGTAMVRDVWADDDGDAKKDASEFHTVAVVGERRGGNHFFALDLTRPEGPETLPSPGFFRWLYPQPNTAAARVAANSYADFLPSAPPIGPVRVKVPEDAPKTGDYRGSPYAERWVVLLNGGYDASLLRGRTVSMVDVWKGGDGSSATQSLWTFSPGESAYPFAAPAAMVGFGPGTLNPDNDPNGYFFDTATIGDVGGQLWTLRFNDPDPSTWTGARAFIAGTDSACGRQPFFQMTANAVATRGGHLRTLVGTGDRYNLTDQAGGSCSATNLVGCLRRGCTLEQNVRRTVCGRSTTFQRAYGGENTATACGLTADSLSLDPEVGTACCDEHVLGEVENVLRCTNTDGAPVEIRWTPRVDCQRTEGSVCGSPESRFVCTTSGGHPADLCERFDRCSAPVAPPDNGFYALKLFDEAERPVFDSPEAGAAYDEAALRPGDLVQVDPYTPSATRAPVSAAGWAVRYSAAQHVFPTAFTGSALNERTTSQAAIVGGCSLFTTSTPGASSGACKPQTLLATTTYQLDFLSGGACSGVDASIASTRLVHRESAEPPGGGQLSVDVTPDGRVNIKLASVSRSVGGAAVVTPVISSNELIKSSYRLPVTRADHACRHPEGATVVDQRASAQASCSVQ
ncbi:MAG TPA: PilC/PilY family type IV pilus protein, partial [Aggregicoccus sp.]|nr:PilC/PilY family type IV pilus protein [Aggregicoccus sp.]